MSSTLEWIQGALIWGVFAGAITFVIAYVSLADWRRTPVARHLLWLAVGWVAWLSLSVLGRYAEDYPARPWIRLAVYGFMAFVVWRQVWLLIRSGRKNDDDV